MADQPLTLRLEIDPDGDPISGRISTSQGSSRPFRGWLELAAVLETFLTAQGARD